MKEAFILYILLIFIILLLVMAARKLRDPGLERDVETLFREHAEFDRGCGREVRV